jgi:hypothetical protein
MAHNDHPNRSAGSKHQDHAKPGKKGIHKDWRAWTAIVLMLVAMVVYVATLDEAVQPEGDAEQTPVENDER